MTYEEQLKLTGEYGVVEQVTQSIAHVAGLPGAHIHELVVFETGHIGEVFLIDRDRCEILILSNEPMRPGIKVARTNKPVVVPCGPELLGQIIDPLGNPLITTQNYKRPVEERTIDNAPPSLSVRMPIHTPLTTGVTIIDMLMPLGKGQRELVIGDRKTGKTQFLLNALKSQVSLGAIGIYAAIGRKKAEVKLISEFFQKEGIADRVIIVATTSSDSPSLIYQTPYSAMTIAEYIMQQGTDVLVVIDDLSTHARFYREISLLAKRFPGREAYPGDIFYTHARLVERAGLYTHHKGEVSISCLPVIEIVEGDFAGYIATNLMGMTDGHIFFDANVFYKGRRPAVNLPLSVTRVGKQAQTKLMKNINTKVTTFLSSYEKMQSLAQFGAELTADTKKMIKTGDYLYKFLEQPIGMVVPNEVQLIMFGLIWINAIEDMSKIGPYRQAMMDTFVDHRAPQIFTDIINVEKFDELIKNVESNKEKLLKIARGELKDLQPTSALGIQTKVVDKSSETKTNGVQTNGVVKDKEETQQAVASPAPVQSTQPVAPAAG